jgi:glycosyltransferase involved in cell wall biosynthesis
VGRLDPVKGQDRLLKAFALLATQVAVPVRLVIAGDGPLRPSLLQLVEQLGLQEAVWLPGARDDVPTLLRNCDVFILPSLNEGISNTIMEAMASARPVIAGRVGGNDELVIDGVTGLLYEAGEAAADIEHLAASMRRYAADPGLARRHGMAGHERVLRDFSLEAMVQRYLDLYDDLRGVS